MSSDKYEPTDEFFKALSDKTNDYIKARAIGDFARSDVLRSELTSAGVIDLNTDPKWHPVFEAVESRSARLRMAAIKKKK